jgi:alkylation response protein AidB-like acyl-CoA dehydrogenase|tara:strand:+ start:10362 stop:11558 length:1197 start_codon:yes stop_codon:yes gene_type:complete
MTDLQAFREETKDWLETNCPPEMRKPGDVCWGGRNPQFSHPDQEIWLERMGDKGWTCPTWPAEYGGGGLSKDENKILQEEMSAIGARSPLGSFGIWMLGPALLEFATEEQKKEHLPGIVKGKYWWCQGYSEPGSGSDLASLSTKAVEDGDNYIINGQKIWTSYADRADKIFCLVRTGPQEPKHDGISFLLIDMDQPGVTTRPITLISGKSPFCETFFDDATAPKKDLVGGLNKGWTVAKRLLEHERTMISNMGLAGGGDGSGSKKMSGLAKVSKQYVGEDEEKKIANPSLRSKVAKHEMNSRAFGLTLQRIGEETKVGAPSPAAAMSKYYGTEHNKLRYELLLEAMGSKALGWEGEEFSPEELAITRDWLRTKANSIEGGTSEVQLNVISKRVLGLPD